MIIDYQTYITGIEFILPLNQVGAFVEKVKGVANFGPLYEEFQRQDTSYSYSVNSLSPRFHVRMSKFQERARVSIRANNEEGEGTLLEIARVLGIQITGQNGSVEVGETQ